MSLIIRPLSPFGAEVIGLDLDDEQALDVSTQQALRAAWVEHGILLFRNALHSEAAHLRLSRVFGEPQPAAVKRINDANNPYLMNLTQRAGDASGETFTLFEVDGQRRTGWLGWHWDQAFTAEIVRGALLRMITPARVDGRTGFIDAAAAHSRLSPAMQQRIEGLEVVYHFTGAQEQNRFGFPSSLRVVERNPQADAALQRYRGEFPPVVHPLVITQHETGRKVLKLSPMHARAILGMEASASDALLHELAEHLVDARHAYFHTWQADDAIVWDNWRSLHSATGVPFDVDRLAQRTTIVGDYKLGRYLDPARNGQPPQRRLDD
ncbi:TauD/TfdA dioxygenase family protein [Aquabacterium sp.]|uniref:TauD/TfdA dioxygenase family protein n=1 Tax=Aquabacterium sp. TaxID=1872578 RepID=UPI002B8F810C|nr:TauD/TfdA family dioxygenase [Aquabacterium sp.]HSW04931.1 TauD/TfdA family dioxygenase [Aquabacterium sp.]